MAFVRQELSISLIVIIGIVFRQYLRANQQVQRMVVENARQEVLEQERQILEAKVVEHTEEFKKANTALTQALAELKEYRSLPNTRSHDDFANDTFRRLSWIFGNFSMLLVE